MQSPGPQKMQRGRGNLHLLRQFRIFTSQQRLHGIVSLSSETPCAEEDNKAQTAMNTANSNPRNAGRFSL